MKKSAYKRALCALFSAFLVLTMVFPGEVALAASAPGNVARFSMTGCSASTVSLSWNKVKGASGYRIRRYDSKSKNGKRCSPLPKAAQSKAQSKSCPLPLPISSRSTPTKRRKENIIFQKSENADRRHQAGKSYLAVCKSKRCKNHCQLEKERCQRLPGDLRPQ